MSEHILERIEKLDARLSLHEKAMELRMKYAESDVGKLARYGFTIKSKGKRITQ